MQRLIPARLLQGRREDNVMSDVTRILDRVQQGDPKAAKELALFLNSYVLGNAGLLRPANSMREKVRHEAAGVLRDRRFGFANANACRFIANNP
jgi:hypothetical protein